MNTLLENTIIVTLLFLAGFYLFRKVKENFTSESGCSKCNACSKIDFNEIEKQIKNKKG